jgi:hypothetical protein
MKHKLILGVVLIGATSSAQVMATWCQSDPSPTCNVVISELIDIDCGTVLFQNGCCKKKKYRYKCSGDTEWRYRWDRTLITPGSVCDLTLGPFVNGQVTGYVDCLETPIGE